MKKRRADTEHVKREDEMIAQLLTHMFEPYKFMFKNAVDARVPNMIRNVKDKKNSRHALNVYIQLRG